MVKKFWVFCGLDEKGVLHFPLFLATFLITLSGIGVWGVLRNWRFLVETQLRLDQCVGEVAREFRDHLNLIQTTNRKIHELRKAIQAAQAEPYLIPPLEAALGMMGVEQEAALLQWKVVEGQWVIRKGCGQRGDWGQSLPQLNLVRDPPDLYGLQELHWLGDMPEKFFFLARHSPRASAARVEGGQIGGESFSQRWCAFWNSPKTAMGLSESDFIRAAPRTNAF